MTAAMTSPATSATMVANMEVSSMKGTPTHMATPAAATRSCCQDGSRQQAARRWDAEEIAWGRECLAAGDSVEEIAATAGCAVAEVVANVGPGRLTEKQREVVSLYTAGCSFEEIDTARGLTSGRLGSAAASMITHLRQGGFPLPYRHAWRAFA
jgi:hypothetical protein